MSKIVKLVEEIFEKANFVANISIVLPQADIKTLLEILPNYSELFHDRNISWRVTDVKGDGILLELDMTNYPHWERRRILTPKQIDYGDVE